MTVRLIALTLAEAVILMENKYWLDRERTSMRMARAARSSRARLVHYQLAGMYNLKRTQAVDTSRLAHRLNASLILASTKPGHPLADMTTDQSYFSCLEQGARYLADRAMDPAEKAEHLRAAGAYAARAREAAAVQPVRIIH